MNKRQLRKILHKVINESKSFPWYESKRPDYPYTHGYGGYGGEHSTIFGNIRDHEGDEPGVIDMIIDWCHEVESLYKDAFDEFEEHLYADFGITDRDPEYKEQSREWFDEHRADWASRYNASGASEVIPQSVWDSLFDYIIVDYMTPREFSDEISSRMR